MVRHVKLVVDDILFDKAKDIMKQKDWTWERLLWHAVEISEEGRDRSRIEELQREAKYLQSGKPVEVLTIELTDLGEPDKNIARIEKEAADRLGLAPGDIIRISGIKSTLAIYLPGYEKDTGKKRIRMNQLLMKDAGAGLGQKVRVRSIDVEELSRIKEQTNSGSASKDASE